MDGRQIKEMLNQRALLVCELLLPGGKVEKNNYVIGDIRGTPGQSLKIGISGDKCGIFHDFAEPTVKGNNLLELWRQVKGISFRDALQEAKEFLGVRDDAWQRVAAGRGQAAIRPQQRGYKKLEDELKPVAEGSPVWKWLTEIRKISPETIRKYKIGEAFIQKGERHCVVFPFFNPAGNLVRMKFRDIDDKGYMFLHPKATDAASYEHGASLHLFGIQGVPPEAGIIVITEGELDALSFADWGYPAVSVPIGAQPHDTDDRCSHEAWIEADYDWLEAFVTIYLALDGDQAGQQATRLLIPRLGRERVMVVDYPVGCKDGNDCILKGHSIDSLIEHAHDLDPEELKKPSHFRDEVWERFYPVDDIEPGDDLPWSKSSGPDAQPLQFMFREGEVTIWHGYNGHGKTIAVDHCLIHFAAKGRRSCVTSLEMPASMTLQNMVRQAIGQGRPASREEFDKAMDWLDRYLWVYDFVGSADSRKILECWEYAAKKYGIHHFVMDSLMRLQDVPGMDFDAQKGLMNRLNDFAKKFKVHVHLVAHSKKPDIKHPKEKNWPGELDISGSSDLPNGAWNVICMWRNENKQNDRDILYYKIRNSKLSPEEHAELEIELNEIDQRNDAMFIVQKQRASGIFPLHRQLWFDGGRDGSWQFGTEKSFRVITHVDKDLPET
jgi:twinkle protein